MTDRSGSIFADRPPFLNGDAAKHHRPAEPSPAQVGAEVTVRAIRQYHEARAFYSKVFSPDADRRKELDDWSMVATDMTVAARSQLLMAVLTWPMEGDPFFSHPSRRAGTAVRPRGVLFEGRLYLGVQDPDDDTSLGEEGNRSHPMRLTILDASSIIDLDKIGGAL